MGDDPPPPPAPPPPPDYAAANREGIVQDVKTLPARRRIEAMSKMGTSGWVNIDGQNVFVDFTGMGEADLARMNIPVERESATERAKYVLDIQRQLGPEFVTNQRELVKLSDPQRFGINEEYAKALIDDFRLGAKLSQSEAEEVEQSVRRGQAARGNIFGNAAAFQEAMEIGTAANARKAQRMAALQSYLGLAPVSAQFGNINQAQGPAPINATLPMWMTNINPNAGQLGAQFALNRFGTQAQIFGTQANIWNTQMQNTMSTADWVQMGIGATSSIAGAMI